MAASTATRAGREPVLSTNVLAAGIVGFRLGGLTVSVAAELEGDDPGQPAHGSQHGLVVPVTDTARRSAAGSALLLLLVPAVARQPAGLVQVQHQRHQEYDEPPIEWTRSPSRPSMSTEGSAARAARASTSRRWSSRIAVANTVMSRLITTQ